MAEKDARTYIRVHDGMPDHPKIDGLSDAAFRLLVTMWCWCSRHRTDGRIPAVTWQKRGSAKARAELVSARLADVADDGSVEMHDYTQHQRTAEEIRALERARAAYGSMGNHVRWHEDRGIVDPNCDHCSDRKPIAKAIANGYGKSSESGNESITGVPSEGALDGTAAQDSASSPNGRMSLLPAEMAENLPETDRKGDRKTVANVSQTDRIDIDIDISKNSPAQPDGFAEFWMAYPRRIGKGQATKAWATAMKRGADPRHVVAAAAVFSRSCAGKDPKFIPHPTTWLNGERYDDEPDTGHLARPAEQRRHPPETVPDDLDPNDIEAYRKWLREG